jgi:hypothetical protein
VPLQVLTLGAEVAGVSTDSGSGLGGQLTNGAMKVFRHFRFLKKHFALLCRGWCP